MMLAKRNAIISRLVLFLMLTALLVSSAPKAFAESAHECSGHVFDIPLSGEIPHELAAGSYYLADDCFITRHVIISGEVNICLNGHSVEVEGATTFHPCSGGVLSFYDCSGEGTVGFTGGSLNNHPLTLEPCGTVNIYGGHFYAKTNSNCINSKGTVNIYGGTVESSTDGYCAVRNYGELNIFGGTLIGADTVWQRSGGAITLAGDSFILEAKNEVFRYLHDGYTSFEVTAPLYLWRGSPEGEYISSEDVPFEYADGMTYLEFAPMRVSVSLDCAGGSCECPLTEHTCGLAEPLPTPVREGYSFTGWLADDGAFASEISAEARGEQHFVAVWEQESVPTVEVRAEKPAPAGEVPAEEPERERSAAPVLIAASAAVLCAAFVLFRKKRAATNTK